MKKKPVRKWISLLDKQMGALVREKNQCEHCKRTEGKFDWAHVIGRGNKTLRWDIFNAMCLCGACHMWWWHEQPLEAAEWFKKTYPERYEYLMKAKNILVQRSEEDYQELLNNIKNKKLDKLIIPDDILEDLYGDNI